MLFLTNINQYTHIYIYTIYIFYGKGPATVFLFLVMFSDLAA